MMLKNGLVFYCMTKVLVFAAVYLAEASESTRTEHKLIGLGKPLKDSDPGSSSPGLPTFSRTQTLFLLPYTNYYPPLVLHFEV